MNRLYRPQLQETLRNELGEMQLKDIDPSYRTLNELDEDGDEFDEDEERVVCVYCVNDAIDIVTTRETTLDLEGLSEDELREEIPRALEGVHEEL